MAPQGALEYRTDLEMGSVEALEQVETRKRKKENASLLDSRLCNPSRKVTATQFPALWKGLLPRFCLHPLLVLGQNKKGGGEWWRSRTPPLSRGSKGQHRFNSSRGHLTSQGPIGQACQHVPASPQQPVLSPTVRSLQKPDS